MVVLGLSAPWARNCSPVLQRPRKLNPQFAAGAILPVGAGGRWPPSKTLSGLFLPKTNPTMRISSVDAFDTDARMPGNVLPPAVKKILARSVLR